MNKLLISKPTKDKKFKVWRNQPGFSDDEIFYVTQKEFDDYNLTAKINNSNPNMKNYMWLLHKDNK